jgi:transposase-like protein
LRRVEARLGRSPPASSSSAGVRQRAVELVRSRDKPAVQIARELGISDSCLRNWVRQADVDDGRKPGLSSAELAALRRKNRVLELEVEILKCASAYFARENVLPK